MGQFDIGGGGKGGQRARREEAPSHVASLYDKGPTGRGPPGHAPPHPPGGAGSPRTDEMTAGRAAGALTAAPLKVEAFCRKRNKGQGGGGVFVKAMRRDARQALDATRLRPQQASRHRSA